MPVNIKVRVVIPRRLKEAARQAPQILLAEMLKAMNASILWTTTKIKEYITEIGLIDTGYLRNRIHGRVRSVSIHQMIGEVAATNVKYGPIHEYGGIISAKAGKALAIPFNKRSAKIQAAAGTLRNVANLFVVKSKGGTPLLLSSDDPTIGWTLVKSVRIREKRFMRTGLQRAMPRIKGFFRQATARAMERMFGRGG